MTPEFRRALNTSDYATVRVMLDKGENVDGVDHGNQDVTPLHMAVGRADVPMVKLLLHAGANPNAKTTYGLSPIAYINNVLKANLSSTPFSEHWRKIYALLREHGARDDLSEEVKAALLER
jgi:ankyrin repeat protein